MILLFLTLFFVCGVSVSEEGDLGYGLRIGNAIDVFANYGDLSQVTQVVSGDYEEQEEEEETEPFREKNIKVFLNLSSIEDDGEPMVDMKIQLCETFEDLLESYFQSFKIEGTDKPWKAFMGDWIQDEIMRTFGIENDALPDSGCYVLVKMSRTDRAVRLRDLTGVKVKEYVKRAIDKLNVSDPGEVRRFMKSYGTHYIDSYETGNFVYQVFKYKRSGYHLLKSYIRLRSTKRTTDNLRFYFSSYFLKQIGDIRIASGNKTVEHWARRNLRDSQYLYSRPSLLRLHYNPILAYELNDLLDSNALLGLELKTLRPLFEDRGAAEMYAEIVENDIKLWEVNA